jgi:hypothetical protein
MKARYYFDQSCVETERVIRKMPNGVTNKCDISAQLAWFADELLRELIKRVRAEEREAAEAGEDKTPWLNDARTLIAKAEGK